MTPFRQGLLIGLALGPVVLALGLGMLALLFGPWRHGTGAR